MTTLAQDCAARVEWFAHLTDQYTRRIEEVPHVEGIFLSRCLNSTAVEEWHALRDAGLSPDEAFNEWERRQPRAFDRATFRPLSDQQAEDAAANPGIYSWVVIRRG